METVVFIIAAAGALIGALGVVGFRNPVHSALSLVGTLFSVAVLFVAQEAHLLAAVQVVVYAGAIVVLFLFVIMLLGVDQAEDMTIEPIAGQRPVAAGIGVAVAVLAIVAIAVVTDGATGAVAGTAPIAGETVSTNIEQIASVLFTDYIIAFELTGLLLTVAVVGAVVLVRRPDGDYQDAPDSALAVRLGEAETAQLGTDSGDELSADDPETDDASELTEEASASWK